jgi:catechol 2,3-dioxygenase-like lactoylglutathione lyase family enzyme
MTRLTAVVLVVRDLDRAVAIYEALGFEAVGEATEIASLGARRVLVQAENCTVELLQPLDDEKPPGLFLRARGEGVFSIALDVDDPAEARDRLAARFVDARGAAEDSARWWIRPADAHGLLIQVSPAGSS